VKANEHENVGSGTPRLWSLHYGHNKWDMTSKLHMFLMIKLLFCPCFDKYYIGPSETELRFLKQDHEFESFG
jgi:hypothetical protein